MQKILFLGICIFLSSHLEAKKIKFSVDMSGQTVSLNGVHVTGDFQTMIGLGPDWDPGKISLIKEGSTNIYSTVLNLPAFKKYEYRFVNGDLSYESEFVPDESRVGYNFNDNRWIYLDSLSNDTLNIGALVYSGNAPAGKFLVRYKVDMTYIYTLATNGVRLATDYKSYDPTKFRLYNFANNVYEIIDYVNTGTYNFRYFNGTTSGGTETVPQSCASSGNRSITVSADMVLNAVCFNGCAICSGLGIHQETSSFFKPALIPNPSNGNVKLLSSGNINLKIISINGITLMEFKDLLGESNIDLQQLEAGLYFIEFNNSSGLKSNSKLLKN